MFSWVRMGERSCWRVLSRAETWSDLGYGTITWVVTMGDWTWSGYEEADRWVSF